MSASPKTVDMVVPVLVIDIDMRRKVINKCRYLSARLRKTSSETLVTMQLTRVRVLCIDLMEGASHSHYEHERKSRLRLSPWTFCIISTLPADRWMPARSLPDTQRGI